MATISRTCLFASLSKASELNKCLEVCKSSTNAGTKRYTDMRNHFGLNLRTIVRYLGRRQKECERQEKFRYVKDGRPPLIHCFLLELEDRVHVSRVLKWLQPQLAKTT